MSEITTVHVPLGERAYDILIGEKLLESAGERLAGNVPGPPVRHRHRRDRSCRRSCRA